MLYADRIRDQARIPQAAIHADAAVHFVMPLAWRLLSAPTSLAGCLRGTEAGTLIFFYTILGLGCVLGATAGYFFLRRWGPVPAFTGVILGLLAGGLLFPFPIHGGVTFFGEVLWEELLLRVHEQADRREEGRNQDFRHALEQRFAGDLPFVPGRRREGLWMEAVLEDGSLAWYDTETGLVWSDTQIAGSLEPGGDVEQARRFCSRKQPGGYWALPTEGELFSFWEHAGQRLSPWSGQSTPSVLVDEPFRMQIPVWYLGTGQAVAVRCVARSPRAPRAGYLRSDVDTSQWNRYQLEKAKTLRGPQ